jgi:hypothetical protein
VGNFWLGSHQVAQGRKYLGHEPRILAQRLLQLGLPRPNGGARLTQHLLQQTLQTMEGASGGRDKALAALTRRMGMESTLCSRPKIQTQCNRRYTLSDLGISTESRPMKKPSQRT